MVRNIHAHGCAIALLVFSTEASAENARARLHIDDMVRRVESVHPRVRALALEKARTEVLLRRAEWDRVRGVTGARAGYVARAERAASDGRAGGERDATAAQLFAELRVPLFASGAIDAAIDSASASVDAARHDTNAASEELKRLALVAYAASKAGEEREAVARRAEERARELVDVAESRRSAGVGSEAEVLRTRLHGAVREEDAAFRRGQREAAVAVLRAALAYPDDALLALDSPLEELVRYRGRGERGLPELVAQDARVRAADANARVARAGYGPTFELVAAGQYMSGAWTGSAGGLGLLPWSQAPLERTNPFVGDVSFGAVVTWRAFDVFVTRDRVADAEGQREVRRAQKAEIALSFASRHAEARARETQAQERLAILVSASRVAEDSVTSARARYEAGATILTEVLDAEIERIGVEGRRVDASFDWAVAHIDRLRAEGVVL